MRTLATTAVAALLLAAAACSDDANDDGASDPPAAAAAGSSDGDGSSGGSGSDGTDPCAVLSVDEVAEATGHPLGEPAELPAGCQWPLTNGTAASHEWQSLPVTSYESNRASAEPAGFVVDPVEGVGNEAFRRSQVNTQGTLIQTELWVALDDEAFFVRSAGLEVDDDLVDAHEELARLLVERLG